MKQITCTFDNACWPFFVHDDGDYLSRKLQSKTHGGPGTWEPTHTRAVIDNLRVGDLAIDLGANMGWYTHIMSNAVGASGAVIALEPNRENFRVLTANRDLNSWSNATILNMAAGHQRDSVWLHEPKNINRGDSRIYDAGTSHSAAYQVPMISVDLMLQDLDLDARRVRFIKIDCQGAEPFILQGMVGCLTAMPVGSCVLMEIWPESWAQQSAVDIDHVFDHMRHKWSITGDDMETAVDWRDFECKVRDIFRSGRYTGRGWDVLLRKL
jgi:FkbM family methyltransferase